MPRWLWVAIGTASIDPLDLARRRSRCSASRSRASAGDHLLRAGAGGHALGLDPGQRPRAALGGDRGAEEDVDLLGAACPLSGVVTVSRVAGGDRDLGAQAALALAHPLGDVGGEDLGLEGLAEHDLVDRLADDLLEARHVDAGLARVEVDEALEARRGRGSRSPSASTRITFSTPVTPTRERLTWVAGGQAWTSGAVGVSVSAGWPSAMKSKRPARRHRPIGESSRLYFAAGRSVGAGPPGRGRGLHRRQ